MGRLSESIKNLFRRKRFSMSDPILGEEDWNVHISAAGLLGSLAAFVLFLFLLAFSGKIRIASLPSNSNSFIL